MSSTESAHGNIPVWTLGERLRKARLYANLSVSDMAEEIGRSERTIRNHENDVTTAPLAVIKQYHFRTGVPLGWLRYGYDATSSGTTARYSRITIPAFGFELAA